MKTNRPALRLALLVLSIAAFSSTADAGNFTKSDNTTNLNLAASWTNNTTAPSAGDIAIWDSTVTGNNTTSLGANMTWLGIQITNPGGNVQINGNNTLTLGASGIAASTYLQALQFQANVVLGGDQTWNFGANTTFSYVSTTLDNGGHTLTINATKDVSIHSNLTGAGGLTLAGTGAIYMANNSTYSGTTTLGGGWLYLGNNSAGGSAGTSAITGTGSVGLYRTDDFTLANTISGNIKLYKYGANTVTIINPNTYDGRTYVNAGNLIVSSLNSVNGGAPLLASSSLGAPTTVSNGYIIFANGATSAALTYVGTGETTDRALYPQGTGAVTIDQAGSGLLKFTTALNLNAGVNVNLIFQGNTSGTGEMGGQIWDAGGGFITSVTKAGNGTWTFSAPNNYTGNTTISGGTLQIGNGGTTGKLAPSGLIVDNANLTINRSNAVAQGTDFSSAAISGNGSFTQAGAGTTTLGAANTYTGMTTINAGTLILAVPGSFDYSSGVNLGTAGSHGTLDLTSKASFNFGSAQSVTGFGTINIGNGKTVTIAGTFGPGNSPGQVNVTGNLALAGTTASTFELAGNGAVKGADFDNATATGTMGYAGTLSIVSFGGYNIDTNINLTYSLFDFTGGYTGNFSGVTVAGTALVFDSGTNTWGASNGGNTAHYTFSLATGDLTVAPEPATWALLVFSLTTVMILRRRCHN